MKYKFISQTVKRISKTYAKSKKGATLVELVCTIVILGIVSSISLSALYSLSQIAVKGQNISQAQRSCALISEQLAVYAKTANKLVGYDTFPSIDGYDETSPNQEHFMDSDASGMGNFDEFIMYAGKKKNSIVVAKFNSSISGGGGYDINCFDVITTIDNIKSVTFKVDKLDGINTTDEKYKLEYTIVALESVHDTGEVTYEINGGFVLNNVKDDSVLYNTDITIGEGLSTVFRLRSTDRDKVDRT